MINLPNGFKVTVPEPIDSKLIMTKAEMLATKIGSMPSNYICLCKDDGKLYIWNANNEKDAELGRFRPYEKVIDLPGALKSAIAKDPSGVDDAISIALPGALREALNNQELKDSGLFVDSDGNIKVGINEEQMEIIDNKIEIKLDDAIRCIEAIDGN